MHSGTAMNWLNFGVKRQRSRSPADHIQTKGQRSMCRRRVRPGCWLVFLRFGTKTVDYCRGRFGGNMDTNSDPVFFSLFNFAKYGITSICLLIIICSVLCNCLSVFCHYLSDVCYGPRCLNNRLIYSILCVITRWRHSPIPSALQLA